MSINESIKHSLKKGDRVAYYINRKISTGHYTTRMEQVRRTGIVRGWRDDGKVIVLHKAGYTGHIAEADLYLVE